MLVHRVCFLMTDSSVLVLRGSFRIGRYGWWGEGDSKKSQLFGKSDREI